MKWMRSAWRGAGGGQRRQVNPRKSIAIRSEVGVAQHQPLASYWLLPPFFLNNAWSAAASSQSAKEAACNYWADDKRHRMCPQRALERQEKQGTAYPDWIRNKKGALQKDPCPILHQHLHGRGSMSVKHKCVKLVSRVTSKHYCWRFGGLLCRCVPGSWGL